MNQSINQSINPSIHPSINRRFVQRHHNSSAGNESEVPDFQTSTRANRAQCSTRHATDKSFQAINCKQTHDHQKTHTGRHTEALVETKHA